MNAKANLFQTPQNMRTIMQKHTITTTSIYRKLGSRFNGGARTNDAGETNDPQAAQRPTKLGLEATRDHARDRRKGGRGDEGDRAPRPHQHRHALKA